MCSTQGTPVPTAFQMPIEETEELVCAAGRDLAVISELDWLTSGASHLLDARAVFDRSLCQSSLAAQGRSLHPSVPKQTKESLRQAPWLNSGYCWSEPQRRRSTFEPLQVTEILYCRQAADRQEGLVSAS